MYASVKTSRNSAFFKKNNVYHYLSYSKAGAQAKGEPPFSLKANAEAMRNIEENFLSRLSGTHDTATVSLESSKNPLSCRSSLETNASSAKESPSAETKGQTRLAMGKVVKELRRGESKALALILKVQSIATSPPALIKAYGKSSRERLEELGRLEATMQAHPGLLLLCESQTKKGVFGLKLAAAGADSKLALDPRRSFFFDLGQPNAARARLGKVAGCPGHCRSEPGKGREALEKKPRPVASSDFYEFVSSEAEPRKAVRFYFEKFFFELAISRASAKQVWGKVNSPHESVNGSQKSDYQAKRLYLFATQA